MIIKTQTIFVIGVLLFIFSCNTNEEQSPRSFRPEIVAAHGYVVPKDSIVEPKEMISGNPTVVKTGKPKVALINTNVHPAGAPKVVIAGAPKVCIPGQDGFSLPQTVPAIDSPFMAGVPEVVMAGEAYAKEQNSQSFSSFGRLQGLKNDGINCLLEDKSGNLWIGTEGSGVSKYDGKNFTHFTVKEGLSNNVVTSMLEDKSGNIWISTVGGLNKYDGKSFTHFTAKEGLSNSFVTSMLEDKSDNIWIGTVDGVNRYDGKSFIHFTEKEGLSNNYVTGMLKDKTGNIWIGTGSGVSKYDGKKFTRFIIKEFVWYGNQSILEDKSGNIWFSTAGGGVIKFDGKSFTRLTYKEGLSDNNVQSIRQDRNGNFWFGTGGGGISKYDGKSFTWFTDKEGLSDNSVRSILEDKRGNLWFATGKGLNKYSGKSFTHFTVNKGLTDNYVRNIMEDKSGNLWVGLQNGGLSKYDGKSFAHFVEMGTVLSMMEDKSGNFWVSTWGGVIKYGAKSRTIFRLDAGVYSIAEDKRGNLWFDDFPSGVYKYDGERFIHFTEKEGLSSNNVLNTLEDKRGNLWFGTYGGGLTKYDGKNFTHFTEKEGLKDNFIVSMLEDKNGNLWIGFLNGGVSRYDGKNFTNFTEKEGLSNNEVTSIMEDSYGNLWFGTAAGLSKLKKDKIDSLFKVRTNNAASDLNDPKPIFETYTYEDGFSGIGVNWGKTICEAKDSTIWIGAGDRLTAFHPKEETPDTIAPNIQLTGLTLFNENIAWQNLMPPHGKDGYTQNENDTSIILGNGVKFHDFHFEGVSKWYGVPENLTLPHNNNYLTFQFVGITLQSPKKVQYRFKLEGLDKNWSALTNRSEATYGNLPNGNYTFKVKAMNGDGYWSKELNYSFIIRPPWWRTWWAYTFFAVLFAGIIYALFRYRLNQIRVQHEIGSQKHRATELEMQALRAQMNPHFIFNSLNSINMFILENNKLQASEYLSKFSRLVRLILQNSQEAFIPLERELEALELYLELEVLRFENKFEYKIGVDNEVDITVLKVPPLIIQPYAENAIWHGLMHKKEKGHLEIELYLEKEILFCKIIDDGIGRKKAAELKTKSSLNHKSMGMRITADRIAILQQEKEKNNTSISITDLVLPDGNPGGTEVLIKIPLCYD